MGSLEIRQLLHKLCMLAGGGWDGRCGEQNWLLSELIKFKFPKEVTLFVIVFPYFLFNYIFYPWYIVMCQILFYLPFKQILTYISPPFLHLWWASWPTD
jgi:hypothetical protein